MPSDKSIGAETSKGLRIIASAAELLLRCAGYRDDKQAETQNWTVFYAVDVDVITLYLAPANRTEYASVFDDEEKATRELLARLVGNFIFRHQPERKLFLIRPHDEELERMVHALSDKVLALVDPQKLDQLLDRGRLVELAQELRAQPVSKVAQWLIDEAPELVEVFEGTAGPKAELDRFDAIAKSRLLHLERYHEPETGWVFPMSDLKQSPEEFEGTFTDWKKRLTQHKAPAQTRYALNNDAYVLATIQLLNKRLSEQHKKIVLITGTRGILDAAEAYSLDGPPSGHERPSFASQYIRHPQSFMADEAFFGFGPSADPRQPTGSAFILVEWLNLFFPKAVQQPGAGTTANIDLALLRKIVSGNALRFQNIVTVLAGSQLSGDQQERFPESMLSEWRVQVGTAGVGDRERQRHLIPWVQQQLEQGVDIPKLVSDIGKLAVQSLSSLYSSTACLALWSRTEAMEERIRGVPALRIDQMYPEAEKYYRKIVETMRRGTNNREKVPDGAEPKVTINLGDMYSGLAISDDSQYLGHTIHALAYAAKGHWKATRTLCRIALAVVDALPDMSKGKRRGREAAYLMAVAERRLALVAKDLEEARRYLKSARDREDREVRAEDSRFLSEAIAIEVAEVNFQCFIGKERKSGLAELGKIVPAAVDQVLQRIEEESAESRQSTREWARQQVLTNVLNLALVAILGSESGDLPSDILQHVRRYVATANEKLFHGGIDRTWDPTWDEVAKFICLAAAVVFSPAPDGRKAARDKLENVTFKTYLPFDKQREKAFRKLAKSTL
jgi:hypothetical protein